MNTNTVAGEFEPKREFAMQVTGVSAPNSAVNRAFKEGRGAGAGVKVLQRVQRKHPNDPKKQLASFLEEFVIKSGTGRLRPVSEATLTKFGETLFRAIDELKVERAKIQNLSELRKVHAERLIGRWVKDGQSAGTIQNKVTILRRFYAFIGKGKAIPKGEEFKAWLLERGIQVPDARTIVARESKTWEDNEVDFFEVVEKVRRECEVTAIQLEMQLAFGLRMLESIQLIPSQSDRGQVLSVLRGTKGGMPREVRFDDDEEIARWQRDVLERSKLIAAKNRKGTLSVPGKTLAQSKAYFYYRIRKHGICRSGLGVTAHGLRHEFAARRYRQVTGFDTPVSCNAPTAVDAYVKAADLQARHVVSIQLGHFRHSVTKSYVGSLPMAQRQRSIRASAYVKQLEGNVVFVMALRNAGVNRAWLGGAMASGALDSDRLPLRLIVATDTGQPFKVEVRSRLRVELAAACGRSVDMSEHFDQVDPDDTIELYLDMREPGSAA